MEERDFSNDTLLKDLAEVFKGLSNQEICLVLSRLNLYMLHWAMVYNMPPNVRLKYFEAAIQVFFCLNRYEQFSDGGFDDDVMDYIKNCFEHIEKMVKCSS